MHRPDKTTPDDLLSVEKLVDDLRKQHIPAETFSSVDLIVEYLADNTRPGDVVITMSNGGFENIHQKLLNRLKSKIM